jgi:hypothetical protein
MVLARVHSVGTLLNMSSSQRKHAAVVHHNTQVVTHHSVGLFLHKMSPLSAYHVCMLVPADPD